MKIKKGFSLLELIVVLTVIGVISTFGYKKYSEIMEDSKATQFADALKKAEMANSKVVAYMGTIRPAPIDNSGEYGDDEALRCYDFRDDQNYKDFKKGNANEMDEYAKEFYTSFKKELLNVGFKEKANNEGLYVQSDPRSVFYSCYRNGMRFFAVSNIKGSVAAKLLKEINNGSGVSDTDGRGGDKRAAIWKLNDDGVYSHVLNPIPTAPLTPNITGSNSPYTDEKAIELSPGLTITFNLTKGTKSATEW